MAKILVDHTGRPLKSDSPSLTWKDLSTQSKATISLVLAVVTALALFLSNISQIIAFLSKPTANVAIDDIDGHEDGLCPTISVYVRNNGTKGCTVTHAEIEILDVVTATKPFRGAEQKVTVDVNYNAEIDFDQTLPFSVPVQDLAYNLAPDQGGAFNITFIPQLKSKRGASIVAFSMRLILKYEGDRDVISDPIVVALLMPTWLPTVDFPPASTLKPEAKTLADHVRALKGKKTSMSQLLIERLDELHALEPNPKESGDAQNGSGNEA